jgi:thioredoxin 2
MHLVCSACLAINSVPNDRLTDQPKCGKCQQPVLSETVLDVNPTQFNKYIQKCELPVVVDFWAPWCGPCQAMAPTFTAAAKKYLGKAVLIKVNTEQQQQLARQYGIRSIPSLKVFKHGKVSAELAGALPQGPLYQWLESNL